MAEDADKQAEFARQDEERRMKEQRDAEATRPRTITYQVIQPTPEGLRTVPVQGCAQQSAPTRLTPEEQDKKREEIVSTFNDDKRARYQRDLDRFSDTFGEPNARHQLQIAEIHAAKLTAENERYRFTEYMRKEPSGTNPTPVRPAETPQSTMEIRPASAADAGRTADPLPAAELPKEHSPRAVNQYQPLRDIERGMPPAREGQSQGTPQPPTTNGPASEPALTQPTGTTPELPQDRQQRREGRDDPLRGDQTVLEEYTADSNASNQRPQHLLDAEQKNTDEQEALKGGKPLTSEQRTNTSTATKVSPDRKDGAEDQNQVPERVEGERSRRKIDFSNFGKDRGGGHGR